MRVRTSAYRATTLVAALALVSLGLLAYASVATGVAPDPGQSEASAKVTPSDPAEGSVEVAQDDVEGAAPTARPCRGCKRPKPHGCTLLSCEDCCWVCIGDPLPLCTS